jgi:DNA-binding transcriptional MocR family regulator
MLTIDAEKIVQGSAARGVIVMPARAPLVEADAAEGGLRIGHGGPNHDNLNPALSTLANIFNRHPRSITRAKCPRMKSELS